MSYSKTSPKRKAAAFKKTNGRCAYCGCALDESSVTIDHMHPRVFGGGNGIDNLVVACKSCNSSKKSRSIEEFRLAYAARLALPDITFSLPQLQWLRAQGVLEQFGVDLGTKFFFETLAEEGGCPA